MTKPVLVLPENTKGRDFVVGDIHGVFSLLEQALKEARFDPAVDRVISVGDLIDRGPESERMVEFLKQPWFFAVRGNHEDMFMQLYEGGKLDMIGVFANRRNGMGWMITADKKTLDDVYEAIGKLPYAIEVRGKDGVYGFVHADVPKGMDWQTFTALLDAGDEDVKQIAMWSRTRIVKNDDSGVAGAKRVFIGHTPVDNGVKKLGNCFFMDTGGVFRVLYGGLAAQFFMAVTEIDAPDNDMSQKPEPGKRFKVISKPKPPAPKPPAPKPPTL